MNDGTRIAIHAKICFEPAPTILNIESAAAPPFCAATSSCTCDQPPSVCSAKGTASSRPDIVTANSNIFTNADDISPPAVQYTIATAPPITQPSHLGMPATVSRIQAIAIICPARIDSAPNQNSTAITAFTALP